ncbi:hypothetical protein GCM10010501_37720 [Streptomyces libani subsp. rufus]|nr:hypothetical protein GCM10010501_37720 [Streptomyces libani subsp. rufus]
MDNLRPHPHVTQEKKKMWNMLVWTMITCTSLCTAGSIFVRPHQCRMRQTDTLELRRRRRMVEVLQREVRVMSDAPGCSESSKS